MTKVVDSKGNELKIGSVVKVKGSNIIREICQGIAGATEIETDSRGMVWAVRVDGGSVSVCKWVRPENLEVVA